MIKLLRTESTHPDFIELVKALDLDLAQRDGDDHSFYAQFNNIDVLNHCVVAFLDQVAVACGAFKTFGSNSVEIKRMYTLPNYRGKGLASIVLTELEEWAFELGYQYTVLETGKKQPEAIHLYTKNGYNATANYGPYQGIENSICFKKQLPNS